ncbi:MAG: hypothetical protein DI582_09795 [Azospirillum brasilense]|nr:MAG: hypothetical protein DI582_09795 [Azospirillum brasilense]
MVRGILLLSASVLALSACSVGRDYTPPELDVDEHWVAIEDEPSVTTDNAAAPVSWWTQFNDDTLDQLIDTALKNNNDLKIAAARIAEARANERLNRSAFFPQIDATARGSRGTMGGAFGNMIENNQQYGVNGSWEIDIFGGNRRRTEAAEAGTEAAIADKEITKLQLIAEVARNYVQLRGLQEQRKLTERNIGLQQRTVQITQAQYNERVVTRLDVLRASAQLKNTRTRLPQIDAAAYAAMNRLTVLLGEKVGNMKYLLKSQGEIPNLPARVVGRAPITTLQRRPDIQAAERRLAQATALSAVAFAGYFPKLSLEGFFGTADSSIYGSSSPWSITLNALLPLLNFGRIEAQVDIAEAREEQAFYGFKQTVLLAIEEVEVSYFGYLRETERQVMFADVAQEQAEAAQVAREQYLNGLAPQLDLLNAEQNALNAETNYVQSKIEAADNLVRLYTALGYGSAIPDTKFAKVQAAPKETDTHEDEDDLEDATAPIPVPRQKPTEYPKFLPPGVDPNELF